jgi:hypothetical protein
MSRLGHQLGSYIGAEGATTLLISNAQQTNTDIVLVAKDWLLEVPLGITITNIDVDNTIQHGQLNVIITGTNFGTVMGTVDIDGVEQANLIWTDTQITVPVIRLTNLTTPGTHTLRVAKP